MQIQHLFLINNTLYNASSNLKPFVVKRTQTSSTVAYIAVNPKTQTAIVKFVNGAYYVYPEIGDAAVDAFYKDVEVSAGKYVSMYLRPLKTFAKLQDVFIEEADLEQVVAYVKELQQITGR